jgi:hypothetical protein
MGKDLILFYCLKLAGKFVKVHVFPKKQRKIAQKIRNEDNKKSLAGAKRDTSQ